jgi:hypothetical protein
MARNDSAPVASSSLIIGSRFAGLGARSCKAALPSFEAALSGLTQAGPGRALSGCIKNPAEMLLQKNQAKRQFLTSHLLCRKKAIFKYGCGTLSVVKPGG